MDVSNPPPPDPIGPKWGADYQSRHTDDGRVPAYEQVESDPDYDGSPAGTSPAAGQDTADVIDPEAPDPEPAAVQPWEPEWVDPDTTAVPVDPALLHDARTSLADGLDVPADLLTPREEP